MLYRVYNEQFHVLCVWYQYLRLFFGVSREPTQTGREAAGPPKESSLKNDRGVSLVWVCLSFTLSYLDLGKLFLRNAWHFLCQRADGRTDGVFFWVMKTFWEVFNIKNTLFGTRTGDFRLKDKHISHYTMNTLITIFYIQQFIYQKPNFQVLNPRYEF